MVPIPILNLNNLKQSLIQHERKSIWDSHLVDFSFKQFSFKARCSLFMLSWITCIECSEVSVIGSLTKVDVKRPYHLLMFFFWWSLVQIFLLFIGSSEKYPRLAASSILLRHYICCTVEMGKYLVKKQVFPTILACVAFSREYFEWLTYIWFTVEFTEKIWRQVFLTQQWIRLVKVH